MVADTARYWTVWSMSGSNGQGSSPTSSACTFASLPEVPRPTRYPSCALTRHEGLRWARSAGKYETPMQQLLEGQMLAAPVAI